jgi:hypothetical protein
MRRPLPDRFSPGAFIGVLAIGILLLAGCGATSSASNDLRVSVAYADNTTNNSGDFPNPWKGAAGVDFKGQEDSAGKWDSGGIRIENTSNNSITVDSVTVDIGKHHYALWGSSTVPANGSLIVAQTGTDTSEKPEHPNFDTSESGTPCQQVNDTPVVHLSVNGGQSDYRDENRILNTGGKDPGPQCAQNESHNWVVLTAAAATGNDLLWAPILAGLLVLFAFLPKLLGALLLLLVGWWLAKFVARLLERLGLGAAAARTGLFGFLAGRRRRDGRPYTLSWLIADLVKWFIFLIFLIAAAQALGLRQLATILGSFAFFLPNLIVAVLVVMFGALVAAFVARVVRGATAEAGFGNPDLIAAIARYGIIAFAVVAAVNQIGVGASIVNAAFTAVVVALALAVGIAFGLGGEDTARQLWERWYGNSQRRIGGGSGREERR